jgi:hypothetical protein
MKNHKNYGKVLLDYASKYRVALATSLLTWAVTWSSCSYSPPVERPVPKAPYPKELVVKKLECREYPVGGVTMSDGNKSIFLGQADGSFRRLDDIYDEKDHTTRLERNTEKAGLETQLGIK